VAAGLGAPLEGKQALFDLVQVHEVVGGEHLALDHEEADLALVQPR